MLPGDLDEVLRKCLSIDVGWLWHSNGWDTLLVKDALLVDVWFVDKQGVRIRDGHTVEVDALSTSEAETDPVSLHDVSIVERKTHFIDGLLVVW